MDGRTAIIEGKRYLMTLVKEQATEQATEQKERHWVPIRGDSYWYTDDDGDIADSTSIDNLIKLGLYSKTKEEEVKKNAVRMAIQRVKIYIGENFGVWEPTEEEWKDGDVKKFFMCYDYDDNNILIDFYYYEKYKSDVGYLKTYEDCEQLIRDCNDDLELIFK